MSRALRQRPVRLSTQDLLVCAAFGTLGAVLAVPAVWMTLTIGVAVPVLYPLCAGASTCAPTIAQMTLRKPGVALLSALVTACAILPFSPQGLAGVLSLAVVGLALEIPYALGRYRHWGAWRSYLGAVLLGTFQLSVVWVALDLATLRWAISLGIGVGTIASYALWTALGRAFGRRLQAAGVGVVAA